MIQLPNNCRCSNLTVFPANWKTSKADTKIPWRISYRFYDDNTRAVKRIVIKRMNLFTDLQSRQAKTQALIDAELIFLKGKSYNPITSYVAKGIGIEINEHTDLSIALQYALDRLKAEKVTTSDIKSCLKYVQIAAGELGYNTLPLSRLKRKHMREILDRCAVIKDTWTNNLYNHYRKYLSILFKELLELDVIENNPMINISKRKTIKKIRLTLTDEERAKVDKFLKETDYNKWRFMHIFFHSGARVTELFKIQKRHVDIRNQRYLTAILKGKQGREVWRPIKNIVLPLWIEVYEKAEPNQYLFAKKQEPGNKAINPHQISRWWRKIKKKLNITADFYSLKHSNTTEVAEQLGAKEAAKLNGHTTETMVNNIYDVNREKREHSAIKEINNPFVKDSPADQ